LSHRGNLDSQRVWVQFHFLANSRQTGLKSIVVNKPFRSLTLIVSVSAIYQQFCENGGRLRSSAIAGRSRLGRGRWSQPFPRACRSPRICRRHSSTRAGLPEGKAMVSVCPPLYCRAPSMGLGVVQIARTLQIATGATAKTEPLISDVRSMENGLPSERCSPAHLSIEY
jgi:hypothetical protein